jgi:hypothetical protein
MRDVGDRLRERAALERGDLMRLLMDAAEEINRLRFAAAAVPLLTTPTANESFLSGRWRRAPGDGVQVQWPLFDRGSTSSYPR